MTTRLAAAIASLACLAVWLDAPAAGQQVGVGAGLNNAGSTFREHFGIHWGVRGRNFHFDSGAPPFAQNTNSFSFGGQRGGFGFNVFGGQGSTRSASSIAPSVTMMNGQGGYFFDGQWRPFVTGVVPLVNEGTYRPYRPYRLVPLSQDDGPIHPRTGLTDRMARLAAGDEPPPEPPEPAEPAVVAPRPVPQDSPPLAQAEQRLAAALASSAGRPAESLADIRRRRAVESEARRQLAEEHFQLGRQWHQADDLPRARHHYSTALHHAEKLSGPDSQLAETIRDHLRSLDRR